MPGFIFHSQLPAEFLVCNNFPNVWNQMTSKDPNPIKQLIPAQTTIVLLLESNSGPCTFQRKCFTTKLYPPKLIFFKTGPLYEARVVCLELKTPRSHRPNVSITSLHLHNRSQPLGQLFPLNLIYFTLIQALVLSQ